jgi:Ni,Fe-hydrogenase III small subunit
LHHILYRILKTGILTEPPPSPSDEIRALAGELSDLAWRRFGHSLSIRHLDAGSCNGCEIEIHLLNSPYSALESLGFRFVASPRHADLLLVTGSVSLHMKDALVATWEAMPNPKRVVAAGDCGIDGGVFCGSYAVAGGIGSILPVHVRVPGCPPDPKALLQGLITAVRD